MRLALGEPVSEGEEEALADAEDEGVAELVVEDEPVTCRRKEGGRRRKREVVGKRARTNAQRKQSAAEGRCYHSPSP